MIPPRKPEDWRKIIGSALTQRLGLKASAVLAALVMWFLVASREPTEDVAAVRFLPLLDSALVLRDPPPPIRALVLGRPSEILKLSQTPLVIRRPVSSDAPDTLVLPLRTSDVEVPEGVGVIVRDVQPHAVTLRFEPTTSRRVPVRSTIWLRAPAGTPMVAVRIEPESVTVLGPRRVVAQLRFIPTRSDSIQLDSLPHLVDLDTTGLGVAARPMQVKATFHPVRQQ